jgi:hypothetical protein
LSLATKYLSDYLLFLHMTFPEDTLLMLYVFPQLISLILEGLELPKVRLQAISNEQDGVLPESCFKLKAFDFRPRILPFL